MNVQIVEQTTHQTGDTMNKFETLQERLVQAIKISKNQSTTVIVGWCAIYDDNNNMVGTTDWVIMPDTEKSIYNNMNYYIVYMDGTIIHQHRKELTIKDMEDKNYMVNI